MAICNNFVYFERSGDVRAALERAWFEHRPLRITYVDGKFIETRRTIRIQSVALDRHETRVDATDLDSGERRQFRLDRIQHAEVVDQIEGN